MPLYQLLQFKVISFLAALGSVSSVLIARVT